MVTEQDVQIGINALLKTKSLNDVKREDYPGASLGTLARFRDGDPPKTSRLRQYFDLPPYCKVPPCVRCGGVHTRVCAEKKRARVLKKTQDVAAMIVYMKFLKRRENELKTKT